MVLKKSIIIFLLFVCSISAKSRVTPLLDSLYFNGDGTYTAVFGYKAIENATITKGTTNKLSGNVISIIGNHLEEFKTGNKNNVFSVRFTGDKISWQLDQDSIEAFADSADYSCLSKPPQEVLEIAVRQQKRVANSLVLEQKIGPKDSANIKIGPFYRYYRVFPENLRNYKSGSIWNALDTITKQWLCGIYYKDIPVYYMVIASMPQRNEGHWKWSTGSYSDTITGKTFLTDLKEVYSVYNGHHPFLVHFETDFLDIIYFSVPEKGRFNLTKLTERGVSMLRPENERENQRISKNLSNALTSLEQTIAAKPKKWANEPEKKE